MTDVWTSAGVVAAIAIVALTGWTRLDAVIALCVAVNILLTGGATAMPPYAAHAAGGECGRLFPSISARA